MEKPKMEKQDGKTLEPQDGKTLEPQDGKTRFYPIVQLNDMNELFQSF